MTSNGEEPEPLTDDEPDENEDVGPDNRIRLAVGLVALEALALVVFAGIAVATIDPDRKGNGIVTVVFLLLYAAGLSLCALGLYRLRSWSRGPVVLAQLIELGLAWNARHTWWLAALLAAPAVVVLVIVLMPSTTVALYGHRLSDTEPE